MDILKEQKIKIDPAQTETSSFFISGILLLTTLPTMQLKSQGSYAGSIYGDHE